MPITREEIDRLHPFDRCEALRIWHRWLDAERKNDKRELKNLEERLRRFLVKKDKREHGFEIGRCIDCGIKLPKAGHVRCRRCYVMEVKKRGGSK